MSLRPATATTQLDDGTLRITRWDLPPATETGIHRHEYDYVVVPIIGGVLTMATPDGQLAEASIAAGESYRRTAGVQHNVSNRTDGAIAFVEIEMLIPTD